MEEDFDRCIYKSCIKGKKYFDNFIVMRLLIMRKIRNFEIGNGVVLLNQCGELLLLNIVM